MTISREKYLDAEEAKRLRQVCEGWAAADLAKGHRQGPLAWAVVDTAMSTGLRVSELVRLTVGDVDLKRGVLRVKPSKTRRKAKDGARTHQDARPLPDDLRDHLAAFIASRGSVEPTEALFVGKRGPLGVQGLQGIAKAAMKRAGLPSVLSIHSLRHTLAVELLGQTKDLRLVQKQLGHSSPTTTANFYADVPFTTWADGLNRLYRK